MSRAEDLLEEVIDITKSLASDALDGDVQERASKLAETLVGQRGRFFYKTLTGVPNTNKCKKAAQAAAAAAESGDAGALGPALSKLEAEVQEMIGRADAPDVVLT